MDVQAPIFIDKDALLSHNLFQLHMSVQIATKDYRAGPFKSKQPHESAAQSRRPEAFAR